MLSTLGIHGLNNTMQQLTEPGLYWVNVPDAAAALNLALRAAALAQSSDPGDVLIVQPELLPKLEELALALCPNSTVEVFSCPHDKRNQHHYFATVSRLVRSSKAQRRSLIVLSKAEHVAANSESLVHQVVSQLQVYCLQQDISILILNYGARAALCSKLLRSTRDHFRGMAELQQDGDSFGYLILFWRSAYQYYSDLSLVLTQDVRGLLQARAEKDGALQQFVDEELLCSNSPLLKDALSASNVFTPASDLKAVYAYGLKHMACYLVFELDDLSRLSELARYIYTLRRQNGSRLKIVVTVSPLLQLRTRIQRLLMRSGANIVFENGAGFGYISSVLDALRHAHYTEALPYSFEVIERTLTIMQHSGLIEVSTFLKLLELELQNLGLTDLSSGCLLRLTFKPQVRARQALRQFAPRRPGDIAAAFADELLIFMLGLTPDKAEGTLSKIFSLKPASLFERIEYFYTFEDLNAQLQELQLKARTAAELISPAELKQVKAGSSGSYGSAQISGSCRLLGTPRIVEL